MVSFTVNGQRVEVGIAPDKPLLWVLRDDLGLKGTKPCCGTGQCGVCTIHLDGRAVRACLTPASAAEARAVTTIEGLARDPGHPVIEAWLQERVPQCGYCQPGQVMAAAALLTEHPRPTDEQVSEAMSGVLCRCGTYPRIRRAIRAASGRCGDLPHGK